jgi:AraC-like DNA-binding protein
MILEAWNKNEKWLHLDDRQFEDDYCSKSEAHNTTPDLTSTLTLVQMHGCFIIYGKHIARESQVTRSMQDDNIAILSFQLNGSMNVNEKNFEPYRIFENDLHSTFFTNKRELVFEAPPVFENFRIILSPAKFAELLAKYHGRFSVYAEMIKRSEYFNLNPMPLPITPRMKMIIHEILLHPVTDPVLSRVYFEAKITELFGCQLEQIALMKATDDKSALTHSDKEKIRQARNLLLQNIAEPPTITRISRSVAINENKLKKGFREMYGKSIYNYLLTHRIEKAIEMMEKGDYSIDEIAGKIGYADAAHFSRAFKNVKGIPPGQYRKSV